MPQAASNWSAFRNNSFFGSILYFKYGRVFFRLRIMDKGEGSDDPWREIFNILNRPNNSGITICGSCLLNSTTSFKCHFYSDKKRAPFVKRAVLFSDQTV
ncbi:hypothetical protein QJ48_16010 [Paenibacillus sp. A3]|nr:hypothetical protein QJ48_16010 [Paenibacillus sp. A3]